MATSSKHLLSVAAQQIGNSGNQYWDELGYGSSMYGQAWCCCYALCMLRREGFKIGTQYLNCGDGSCGLQTGLKAIGAYQVAPSQAKAGDVFIFDFVPRGGYDHTGFCELAPSGGYVQTNEGNVSGKVGRRSRALSDIRQCWRIPYDSDATTKNGWEQKDGKWYHYTVGVMDKNKWIQGNDGKWYWLGSNGVMAENEWVKYDGKWYWLGKDGAMQTSQWLKYDGAWYYLNTKGNPVTGWYKVNGEYFHFDTSGKCEVNTFITYKGDAYFLGDDGRAVKNQDIVVTFTYGGKEVKHAYHADANGKVS